jgi:hypothetical protein
LIKKIGKYSMSCFQFHVFIIMLAQIALDQW